jgi:hypothetical protein
LRLHRLRAPLVAAALIAFLAFGGSAAASVPNTSLPLHGYSRMVSDPANGRLFVTGGSSDSTILVRNEDGSAKGSIAGEAGAGGMVLDGSTLYVARCGWSVIDEIDTTTLTRTGSISAPDIGGTCDLAEAGGALWYANSSNHLVSVTVDAAHTTTDTGEVIDGELATTPAHPDWLVAVYSEAWVYVYDVTDPTTPSLLGSAFSPGTADAIDDIAVTPDGADVLIASGAPYELQAFALPGLTADGVYPTDNYPNSVAVSADGSLIASGSKSYYDKDVFLFPAGTSTAKAKWDFNSTDDVLYPHGLAFSADGTRLYAASKGSSGNAVVLRVLPAVTLPKGAVSLKTSASTIAAGHALTVTAHLGTASSNRTVSIYRKPVNGQQVLVKKGTVGPAGNLGATIRPTATRPTRPSGAATRRMPRRRPPAAPSRCAWWSTLLRRAAIAPPPACASTTTPPRAAGPATPAARPSPCPRPLRSRGTSRAWWCRRASAGSGGRWSAAPSASAPTASSRSSSSTPAAASSASPSASTSPSPRTRRIWATPPPG